MSVLGKKWEILNKDQKAVKEKILENRGLSDPDDLAKFLKPDFEKGFHDPYLFTNMDRATDRIHNAIGKNERIIVYGDYDVDGISGAAILVLTLQHLGAQVSYRLPHRVNDGYGVNEEFINEFENAKVGLIVTVDCGISNAKEITIAKQKGIDTIVTDHHTIPENFPDDAYTVIHPKLEGSKYPFKELTGAGVAFKLAHALLGDDPFVYSLLDLASLGTVADCGPIVGENRLIVKKGLELLPQTKWEGLKYLQEVAGVDGEKPLSTRTIGFQIAPRINAAGRIDSPYFALQLLIKESKDGEKLAKKLEKLNRRRQTMLENALKEAENRSLLNKDKKSIIEYDKKWHVGILGLIAGRLAEKYSKPTIIMQECDDYLVASARSPNFYNIIEPIAKFSKYLENFGGHAQAAGFSLKKENVKKFIEDIRAHIEKELETHECKPSLKIDCEIEADEVNWDTLEFIDTLKPFGIKNERPTFIIRNSEVENAKAVGKDEKHLNLQLNNKGNYIRAIGFNLGPYIDIARKHKKLDLVFQLEENNWKGRKSLQLKIVDFTEAD